MILLTSNGIAGNVSGDGSFSSAIGSFGGQPYRGSLANHEFVSSGVSGYDYSSGYDTSVLIGGHYKNSGAGTKTLRGINNIGHFHINNKAITCSSLQS